MENCLVTPAFAGSCGAPKVWGRATEPRNHSSLCQSDVGIGKKEQELAGQVDISRQRRGRRQRKKGQKEQEGRRQDGRAALSCDRPESSEQPEKAFGANLFHLINCQHGSFSRYWKLVERSHKETGVRTPHDQGMGQTIALFPSRLPWKSPPGKSRRGLPKKVVWEAYHWIHRLWALLNFLNDGSPSSGAAASQCIRRASQGQWTALHESYARTMFAKVLSFCSHPRGTMDRGSARLSQLIERIQNSHYDPSISLDEAIGGAMEVNPDRISLPEVAGIIDPMEHLKGDRLVEFETMPSKIPTVKRSSHDPPACHKVSDENWPTVLRKLHAAGMITFIPKSQVLAEGRRLIKGGLFCVPHKDVSDRLINERRPANLRERRLGWCQLPNGALLSQLILESWESVRASGDDLSNYFYLIQHLESWHSRNCFGRPFRGSLLPEMQLDPQSLYLPAFRVVCMGDTNGVDLAQAVHEAILRSVGCLQPEHTLVHGRIFPCSKTLEGLYIDDHLAFQIVDKKPLRDRNPLQDEVITKKTRARYEELGLPRSLKKGF